MKKRLLAVILSLSMTASLFTVPAFAEEVIPAGADEVTEAVLEEEVPAEAISEEETQEAEIPDMEISEEETKAEKDTTEDASSEEEEFVLSDEVTGYGVLLEEETVKTAMTTQCPTPQEAHDAIMAMKSEYPEGMHWTNDDFLSWHGGIYIGGYGCAGFAFGMSDAAFGDLPARMVTEFSYSDVHVGDILRVNNNAHSVIVTDVYPSYVVIAEGNYNSSIHWGRTMTKSEVEAADYVMTRYPVGYFGECSVITLDFNGVMTDAEEYIKENGKTFTIPDCSATKFGYYFWGWGAAPDASEPAYEPGDTYTEDKSITLYAMWRKMQYPLISSSLPQTKHITVYENEDPMPYEFRPTESAAYIFESTNSTGDPKVYVEDADGNIIAVNDDYNGRDFYLLVQMYAGDIYYIIPASYNRTAAEYDLNVRKMKDSTISTSVIDPVMPQSFNVTLPEGEIDVAYLTPNATGNYTFESSGDADSLIYIYESGSLVAYNDDAFQMSDLSNYNFKCTTRLVAGNTYRIVFRTNNDEGGSYTVHCSADCYTGPRLDIISQPEDITVNAGEYYMFNCTIKGTGYYFQAWEYSKDNGKTWIVQDMDDISQPTWDGIAESSMNGYLFRCRIEDYPNHTTVYSDTAKLTVKAAGLKILHQPVNMSAGINQQVYFYVDAANVASYQWQYKKAGTDKWVKSAATGCATDTVYIKVSKSNSGNVYRCKLTGLDGTVKYTDIVTVDLIPGVKFNAQPESPAVTLGTNVKFTVDAENVAEAGGYQWYYSKDGEKWYKSGAAGNTTATLTVTAAANTAASMYRCKVLGIDGNYVNSAAASFVILTEQPKNSSAAVGKTATFSLKAENALSYQWQYSKDGVHWYNSGATGATTDTISFKVTSSNRLNMYRCKLETATGVIAVTNPVTFTEGLKITKQNESYHAGIGMTARFYVTVNEEDCSYQWQYTKDGTKWTNSNAETAKTSVVTFTVASANKNNKYRCKITGNDGTVIYSDPAGIEGHDLYYGYVPTQFGGEYGPTVTSEHYIYCKICNMRASTTCEAHEWDQPAEGATCTKCGAFLYPDMHENEPVEHKVAAGSADEAKFNAFYCPHTNCSVSSALGIMIKRCDDCGYTRIS